MTDDAYTRDPNPKKPDGKPDSTKPGSKPDSTKPGTKPGTKPVEPDWSEYKGAWMLLLLLLFLYIKPFLYV